MQRHVSIQFIVGLCAMLFMACKSSNQPDNPTLDKYPELVAACANIQGGGAATTGGDGGTVYRVSRLDDEINPSTGLPMTGTLRYAVTQSGKRRIIFTKSGTIHLTSELKVKYGNLTIDGQSAPGDGICIADYPLVINADNVIVRFIRVRLGDESQKEFDAVSVNDATNVVLDHLSCSWSVDECVSCYGNTNFTMQYCIVSESLTNSVHGKGTHGYGGIWGGANASFHHNLLAHHGSRNPRFDHDYVNALCTGPIDHVNNVIYNWGGNSAYGGEGSTKGGGGRHINMVNNYYKYGPATSKKTRIVNPTTKCSNCTNACGGSVEPGKFYVNGNYVDGSTTVTADNWQGVDPDESSKKEACKASTRWTTGLTSLTSEQTAEQAYLTVLTKAGCSLSRDAVDTRIVDEVTNRTYTYKGSNGGTNGLIDTQGDVGGWPDLETGTAPIDTDYDGMPDDWETQYGLDPNDADDAKAITLVTGHTNLDVYMCYLVRNLY